MNNFIRITIIILTFLFGGLSAAGYIISEIAIVIDREDMEGYFNFVGMLFVINALVLIVSNIPSILCQIKIMMFNRKTATLNTIDEGFLNNELRSLKWFPSKFLRNANLTYAVATITNFLLALVVTLVEEDSFSPGLVFVLVIAIVLTLCGVVQLIDALRLKRRFDDLILTTGWKNE